jgi:hypothetical protein
MGVEEIAGAEVGAGMYTTDVGGGYIVRTTQNTVK